MGDAAEVESRVAGLEDDRKKTRDVARSAMLKAEQEMVDPDQQEGVEQLPEGIEPSSSPLDFFANCRETKIKELFVERSNRQNTYRVIKIAKRWKEFATERSSGSGVFFTKEDVTTALTAELGKAPHRQTVKRVWEKLLELGGDDVVSGPVPEQVRAARTRPPEPPPASVVSMRAPATLPRQQRTRQQLAPRPDWLPPRGHRRTA